MERGFIIDGWRVVPVLNRLERGDEHVRLKPRSMDVLVELAKARGDVVKRPDLMRSVWGNAIVTEDVLTQSVVEIRKAFADDARRPRVVETIRKVGFRLVAEVETIDPDPVPASASFRPRSGRRRWIVAGVLGLLAVAAMGIGWRGFERPAGVSADDRQSIAVMPFENLGDDPDTTYFSRGLSEDILNALAQVPGLKVTARTSAFALARRGGDVRQLGEQLGVRTVLEGSVQQDGQRLRITAQLIDARSGYHLWSKSWDRELGDVFAIQEEIAASIVRSLLKSAPAPDNVAIAAPGTNSVEAYDLYLLGRHYQDLGQVERARDRFERALEADPKFARAYAGLAETYLAFREVPYAVWQAEVAPEANALDLAEQAIETALTLDPRLTDAYVARAELLLARLECKAANAALEQALALNPKEGRAHFLKGRHRAYNLQMDEALEAYRAARELDPLNPRLVADLSRLTARMGLYEDANRLLLDLQDRGIQSPILYETLMLNADDFGHYDDRVRWGMALVQLVPGRASALAELGDAYSQLGMLRLADRWITAAEEISAVQAYKARQRWLWIQQRDDEFIAGANRMLKLYPPGPGELLTPVQAAALGIGALARLHVGDAEAAAEFADRAVSENPSMLLRGIHRILYGRSIMALAQRAAGQDQAARQTVDAYLDFGNWAREQSEAGYPPLLRQMALLHALRGEQDIAMELLAAAVAAGWRASYLDTRQPGDDGSWSELIGRPDYKSLEEIIEADLERMRARVLEQGLDRGPEEWLAVL